MKPTMEEVAELAQVSRATVSRVLSDSTKVSAAKRRSVLDAVEKLGYEPLKQSSIRVPIMVAASSSPGWERFYDRILEGIEEAAITEKVVIDSQEKDSKGYILLGNASLSSFDFPSFKAANAPVVIIDGLLANDEYSSIGIEERKVMIEVIQTLVNLGHRQIAFIGGPEHDIMRQERLRAYKLGILAARLSVNNDFIYQALNWDQESGYYGVKELLSRCLPTAIVVANSHLALGVYDGIIEKGLRIPKDISVVAFDDLNLCNDTNPPMSTITVPLFSMGKWAVTILSGLINDPGRCPVRLNVPAVFCPRQSIGRVNY